MKLDDIWRASALAERRAKLVDARKVAETGDGLGITIRGTYQDGQMIAAVKGAVAAEFERRISAIDAELTSLGVELS
jgi:methyl coenzyme M reductase subunit C